MLLNINGTDYKLKFGIKFVSEIDKLDMQESNGVKFGIGLMKRVALMDSYDVEALVDVITIANRTETPRIKQAELFDYLENDADIEALFAEVLKELREGNITRGKLKALKDNEK
jgi:hypothetical protein